MAENEKALEQEETAKPKELEKADAKEDTKKSHRDENKRKNSKENKKSDKKDKKKNVFARIGGWFKDLKKEFSKVVWPTKKKVINNTIVVLLVVLIGSVLIGLIDSGLLKLMQFLMGLSD